MDDPNRIKCDMCSRNIAGGELVWTYTTPSTGTLEQAQAGEAYYCEDPEWAICTECDRKIVDLEIGNITEEEFLRDRTFHSVRNQGLVMFGEGTDQFMDAYIKSVAGTIYNFLRFKLPDKQSEVNLGLRS